MTPDDLLAPVREAASRHLVVLANGKAPATRRLLARIGLAPALPTQVASGHSFVAELGGASTSATLSIVNRHDPALRFVTCRIDGDGALPILMDRNVIDEVEDDVWRAPSDAVGDALARNLRLLKHAPWHSSDDPEGPAPTEILCDRPKELGVGFTLMKDILAASGRTGDDQFLSLTLPTGTRPLRIDHHGFESGDLETMTRMVSRFLPPSLQVWSSGATGAKRVSRVHARASAAGCSPMESLRAADRLVSILGETRMRNILLR